ncbi:MAG: RidA family protein, partial [Balneolaceae bacterium]|nr:RidA family protein [Balneolaceae bacterium]
IADARGIKLQFVLFQFGEFELQGTLVGIHVSLESAHLSLEQGNQAARLTGISMLSSLKAEIGDMNKVKRFIQVTGMVNADPSFTQHSQVINGFSDLMVEIFGEDGKHVRAAVGMSSLPFNMAVEIMAVVEVTD